MMKTLIVDNGAYAIKAGYSDEQNPRVFPNAVFKAKSDRKRVYVADELEECQDRSSLYFVMPFERGYLINWDTELQIWDRVFGKKALDVDFQGTRLLLTDPCDIAKAVKDVSHEIVFETYEFNSFLRTSAPSCVAQADYLLSGTASKNEERPCCLIVDSGHSFTHIVPFIRGQIVRSGICRIDVGGKLLTNQLKEWISFRHMNLLEETYMVNQCKEDICFVTRNLQRDMEICKLRDARNTIRRDYLLPDFVEETRGVVRLPSAKATGDRSKICLGVERFAIPEILFHPSDVGLNQMGIVDAIHHSLMQMPEEIRFEMLRNIVLVGGNANFEGYEQRIEHDLRPLVDEMFDFKVSKPADPTFYAWVCAAQLMSKKLDFLEYGAHICQQRFRNFVVEDF